MRCWWGGAAVAVIGLALYTGCGRKTRSFGDDEGFPEKLSEWNLFAGKLADLRPAEGVIPYDLNTPLFSDYATKTRFVRMPAGTAARYRADDVFEFPVGTVLAKSFAFTGRIIETRLLVRTRSGWYGLPYVWNRQQTDARLEMTPDPVRVSYTHASGETETFDYPIPNANQCKGCHDKSKAMTPLGPKARNLNRDFAYADGSANQLAYWTKAGYLQGAPSAENAPRAAVWNDPRTGTLEDRAKAYLDVNCGHCHNPEGPANSSGLYLTYGQSDPMRLGFRKVPVSAGNGSGGLLFDVVAGHPEQSIVVHRMQSTEPKILMPELGRSLVHREGVALISEWIRSRKL